MLTSCRWPETVNNRVCSSVWLERTPDKGEVGSSSLPRPTKFPVSLLRRARPSYRPVPFASCREIWSPFAQPLGCLGLAGSLATCDARILVYGKACGTGRGCAMPFRQYGLASRGHSSAGRAPALHAGGRRFDPAWLHHLPGRWSGLIQRKQ